MDEESENTDPAKSFSRRRRVSISLWLHIRCAQRCLRSLTRPAAVERHRQSGPASGCCHGLAAGRRRALGGLKRSASGPHRSATTALRTVARGPHDTFGLPSCAGRSGLSVIERGRLLVHGGALSCEAWWTVGRAGAPSHGPLLFWRRRGGPATLGSVHHGMVGHYDPVGEVRVEALARGACRCAGGRDRGWSVSARVASRGRFPGGCSGADAGPSHGRRCGPPPGSRAIYATLACGFVAVQRCWLGCRWAGVAECAGGLAGRWTGALGAGSRSWLAFDAPTVHRQGLRTRPAMVRSFAGTARETAGAVVLADSLVVGRRTSASGVGSRSADGGERGMVQRWPGAFVADGVATASERTRRSRVTLSVVRWDGPRPVSLGRRSAAPAVGWVRRSGGCGEAGPSCGVCAVVGSALRACRCGGDA
jgi:hypothetical protein